MWKPGQLVTIGNRVYRVTKTDRDAKYRSCYICQMANTKTPCINGLFGNIEGFNVQKCAQNLHYSHYLRQIKPKRL